MKDAAILAFVIIIAFNVLLLLWFALRAALKLPKRNAYVKPVTDTRSSITNFYRMHKP